VCAGEFDDASAFNYDISKWNVDSATDLSFTFRRASAFDQNIGSWDVARVTKLNYAFEWASAFNQNIGSWNVASVTDLSRTFSSATAFNQNVASWSVFRVSASEFVDLWKLNALSDGNKEAIYAAWGENFQAAYPTFGSTLTTTRSPTRAPTLQNNFLSGSLPSNLRSPPPVAPTPTPTQPPTPRCVPHHHHSARIDQIFDVGMSVQPDVDTNACSHAELRAVHVAIVGPMHRQRFAPCARSSYIRGNSICCVATCGGGESRRYRSIEIAPLGPGVPDCPSTAETKDCNFQVRSILDTAAL